MFFRNVHFDIVSNHRNTWLQKIVNKEDIMNKANSNDCVSDFQSYL